MIFLPGTDQQVKFFLSTTEIGNKQVLIIGSGTVEIAQKLLPAEPSGITIIVEDYDSLITMRYRLEKSGEKHVHIRMMDFDNTDFRDDTFDIIYVQAAVSVSKRNKIIKEIKKILKPGGILCAGEIMRVKENPPAFIVDIWNSSDLQPLSAESLDRYYTEKGFEIIDKKDLSFTLKDFYMQSEKMLLKGTPELSDEEKSYYKKLLRKISHESNVYLKLGGSEYMGFIVMIMRKQ
jgi:ubiquinone/menaquinone biosynthesis C-methylase UbiE